MPMYISCAGASSKESDSNDNSPQAMNQTLLNELYARDSNLRHLKKKSMFTGVSRPLYDVSY